jgi:signal transduction histidine kinase
MGQFKLFFRDITRYAGAPEIKPLWLAFLLLGAIIVINVFFLPAFLAWLTIILFLAGLVILIISSLRAARAGTEIKIKNRELESVIDGLDAAVIGYDPSFKIIAFNKAAEKFFNISAQEVIGRQFNPGSVRNPRFRQLAQVIFPSFVPLINQISEPNVWPQIVDIVLEEPLCEFRTILTRIADEKGEVLAFFKIVRDRTREKVVLRSKSEFINVAAHQMRTPLNAINWTFESLIKSITDKNLKEVIQSGYEVSQRALKIVNDLLDVSRIEEGKFGYNFENADLSEFIKNVLDQFKLFAGQYQAQLYLKPLNEKFTVRIDPQKLSIALSNLIDNAIRYNVKNGNVEISAERIGQQPFVRLIVKDTGVGIPPAEIEKLFKKFYRGSNVVPMEPNGSGLGLYITKNIIQQHGGEINVESILDRGSTFSFTLPLDFSLIPTKEVFQEEN